MRRSLGGVSRVVMTMLLVGSVAVGCSASSSSTSVESVQQQHRSTKAELVVQLQDDFSKEYGPPHHFDMERWTKVQSGAARIEQGRWLMELLREPPAGPGVVSVGGFATTQRLFTPGLKGANGVEITIYGFSHEDYPEEMNKTGQLEQAWSMTIGSWRGMVGGQNDKQKDRGVQLHFDLIRDDGLYVYLVRGIVPEDYGKYPQDGYGRPDSKDLSAEEKRRLHIEAAESGGTYITPPCLALATRVYRSEVGINYLLSISHRYGLYLTDDADTVYWTLDGQVMDRFDISGYFSSSAESVAEGAFLTIAGVSIFQRNTWAMDDLEVRVSAD